MKKLRKNAMKIAELNGWQYQYTDRWTRVETYSKNEVTENSIELKHLFSSFDGLLPLVLECAFSGLIDFEIFSADRKIFVEISECGTIKGENPIKTEEEFIKEIQLLIIQYLEFKNGK